MGFLDKIKNAKNLVTGGGAKVHIEFPSQALRGAQVPVKVTAEVTSGDLKVSRVYVRVRAREVVEMTVREDGHKRTFREDDETFSHEFVLTGPLELAAGSLNEWTGELDIPTGQQPSYQGRYANHVWEFQAALDVRGNDPDSGWQEISIN